MMMTPAPRLSLLIHSAKNNQLSPIAEAIIEARKALAAGEVPVGAVIVQHGNIIARAHNLTKTNNDPTAHAEIVAIRAACEFTNSQRLVDCDLYVTLEPCAMCAAAISFARIRRLYFGAVDEKSGGVENGARFFTQPTCHHKPETYATIAEKECRELLKTFFASLR